MPQRNELGLVLGLHMNGLNGSTFFRDECGHTVTANGNAQISTAQSKFGGSSGYFDGSGDYLSISNNTDFNFLHTGNTNWIWTFWIYPVSLRDYDTILDTAAGLSTYHGFALYIMADGRLRLTFMPGDGSDSHILLYYTPSGTLTTGSWIQISLVYNYSSKVLTVYKNGVSIGTQDMTSWYTTYGLGDNIQARIGHSSSYSIVGYLSDFYILKGITKSISDIYNGLPFRGRRTWY